MIASNGSGTNYNITLANANNNFGGSVTATGANVNVADSGASGLTLGNTTATGTLTLEWSRVPGLGGNGRGTAVSEVWLIKLTDGK